MHGIDMLQWNAEGRLVEFTVMVRPLKGLQQLIELMAAELFRDRRPTRDQIQRLADLRWLRRALCARLETP